MPRMSPLTKQKLKVATIVAHLARYTGFYTFVFVVYWPLFQLRVDQLKVSSSPERDNWLNSNSCAGLFESQRTRFIRQKGRTYGTCVWVVWCPLMPQIFYMRSVALFGVILYSRPIWSNVFIEVPDIRVVYLLKFDPQDKRNNCWLLL